MRLNHDYVRDILLFIEQDLEYHAEITNHKLLNNNQFTGHNQQELAYALELLIKEYFIECAVPPHFNDGKLESAIVIGLTWKGHEMLDNIRSNKIWASVKRKAKYFNDFSLSTLYISAKNLTASLMTDPNAVQSFMDEIESIRDNFKNDLK